MRVAFAKYEGLGNDFVIVDELETPVAIDAEIAARICDRHLGVGADGVLLVTVANGQARMRVINADGSVPEMCGNGIRCVALHLVRTGRALGEQVQIETDAGVHACRVVRGGTAGVVEVSMRAPSLAPADVPVVASAPVIDEPLQLGVQAVNVTCVSMGNPHAVTFAEVGEQRFVLGPQLQAHERFPRGVNVGFARVIAPQALELTVFERGAGWTRACGTGACAAAVAAVETGRAQRGLPIEVQLPGGALSIVVGRAGERLSMTGPARHVFDGTVEL
jgi:diaminopimelate epimerase